MKQKLILVYQSQDGSDLNIPRAVSSNVLYLNENKSRDLFLNAEIQENVYKILEVAFDKSENEIPDLLRELNSFYLNNDAQGSFRFPIWELDKIFNRDIESSGSKVRLFVYLNVYLALTENYEVEVFTDCAFFNALFSDQGINVRSPIRFKFNWLQLCKSFFSIFIMQLLICFRSKKIFSPKPVLFQSFSANWKQGSDASFDRHYGNLKNLNVEKDYIHFISSWSHRSKFKSSDVVTNSFLTLIDFVELFFKTVKSTFIPLILPRFKYRHIYLYKFLILIRRDLLTSEWPLGYFYARSLKRFFEAHPEKVLVTYTELFPFGKLLNHELPRGVQHFTVQHSINSKSKLINHDSYVLPSSYYPAWYLIQGSMYDRDLDQLKVPVKRRIIGSLKFEKMIFHKDIPFNHKHVLVVPSLNDIDSICEILAEIDSQKFDDWSFFISSHPAYPQEKLMEKIKGLNIKIRALENISSLEFSKQCEYVISSYSSVGIESLFYNRKLVRVFSSKLPRLFDYDSRIPTFSKGSDLEKYLLDEKEYSLSSEEILKDYFGHLDGQVFKRFERYLLESAV